MDHSMLLYWEIYKEHYSNEQIVHKSYNPLRDYEDEFIDGPILDIGCGQSNFLIEYAPTKRDIYAIDNEKYQLEALDKRILDFTKGNSGILNYLELTVPNDDLPNKKFALIILSNILHFFEMSDCAKLVGQLVERTSKGSMIYILVHSVKYYANDPKKEDNNEHFKHYFTQEDLDNLFSSEQFDRIYSADIQRDESKLDKLIVDKWIDKNLDAEGINNERRRKTIKADYLKDKLESDIATIYRRK